MKLSKITSIVRLCLQVWSREWGLVTVRLLRTRLCALRTRNVTNSSLSQKGAIQRKSMSKVSQPVFLRMSSVTWFIPSKVWKMQRWCEPVTPLSMTWSCLTSCERLWKLRKFQVSSLLVRQMERQVTKKLLAKGLSRVSMRLWKSKASLSWFWSVVTVISGWWLMTWWPREPLNPTVYWLVVLNTVSFSVMTMRICVWRRWDARLVLWMMNAGLALKSRKINLTMRWSVSTVSNSSQSRKPMPRLRRWASSRWQMRWPPRNSFAVQKFLTKMWWPSSDQLQRTWMTRLSNWLKLKSSMKAIFPKLWIRLLRWNAWKKNAFQLILIGMILILSQQKPVRSSNSSIQKPSAKPAVFRE